MTRSYGWAVEIAPTGVRGEKPKYLKPYLVGRFCLTPGASNTIPPQLGGYRTAVFETRRAAEQVAKENRRYTARGERKDCILYKYVRVVWVEVTVKICAR